MMATANAHAAIQDLKSRISGIAVALVSRDGQVLSAEVPAGTYAETFAIMCATVLGAAVAANRELNRAAPDRAVIRAGDATTLIVGAGRAAMLVAMVEPDADTDLVLREVTRFAELFQGS